jgi:DNA-directed RNA polymerase subunit M/transcription elongation factor TFIIS
MIAVKGRRKCTNCGKRYNYTYSKGKAASKKAKFKGKYENLSTVTNVKVLSINTYEVTANCPECGFEETFIYND